MAMQIRASIIHHPKLPFVILRSDYLAMTKGNHCAAKLLAVFENWTDWFFRQGKPDRWVKLTSSSLGKHLLGEHNQKQIRAALKLLKDLKLIRQEKRRANQHDQSWFYWLDIELVQEAIDKLAQTSEPETEEDFIKISGCLEQGELEPAKSVLSVKTPETLVALELAKSATSIEPECPIPCGQISQINPAKLAACLNKTFNKTFNSSSNLIREEDLKFEEKKIQDVDQVEESETLAGTNTLPPGAEQKDPNDIPSALLTKKPKLRDATIDPEKDSQPLTASLNGDLKIDQDLLLWVMEVKLPTMQLKKQPINVEAYAKSMIRRDGEKLKAEFADLVAEQKFIKKAAELTEQVEARVREWQKVSHAKLTIFHDLDGMPCVLLDGITIGAVDFLAKLVEPAPMVATIPFSPENRVARPARTSRLKMSSKINSNPGFEFLEQCWEDFFLRPQVSLILAKHPDWAVVKDGKLYKD